VADCEPTAKEYRATIADSYGHADVLRGWTDGDLLTFQSMDQALVRIRLLWHLADAERMTWRNEMSVGGTPFTLVERYECTIV
jgi:hypothetical protein